MSTIDRLSEVFVYIINFQRSIFNTMNFLTILFSIFIVFHCSVQELPIRITYQYEPTINRTPDEI